MALGGESFLRWVPNCGVLFLCAFISGSAMCQDAFLARDTELLLRAQNGDLVTPVEGIDCLGRHPEWKKWMPAAVVKLRKVIEKKLCRGDTRGLSEDRVRSFFNEYMPTTVKGWELYLSLTHDPVALARLKDLWEEKEMCRCGGGATLSSSKQTKMIPLISKELPSIVLNRVENLLWSQHIDIARDMFHVLGNLRSTERGRAIARALYLMDKSKTPDMASAERVGMNLRAALTASPLEQFAFVLFLIRQDEIVQAKEMMRSLQEKLGQKKNVAPWEGIWKLRTRMVKELCQRADKMARSGNKKEAELEAEHALELIRAHGADLIAGPEGLRDVRHGTIETWLEAYWKMGWIWFYGFKDPEKALKPWMKALEVLDQSVSPEAGPGFTNLWVRLRHRYRAKLLFWSGVCFEHLGQRARAKTAFAQAAKYPFFLFGQLAAEKAGLPVAIRFAFPNSGSSSMSRGEREVLRMLAFWKQAGAKKDLLSGVIKDASEVTRSPQARRHLIDLLKRWGHIEVTFFAKRFSADPRSTFPETYPRVPIPAVPRLKVRLDPAIVYAIILAETAFDPMVISSAGAKGIMQLMPFNIPEEAKKLGLPVLPNKVFDRVYNMQLGISHLIDYFEKANGDPVCAIASYNAGEKAVNRWRDSTPGYKTIEETLAWAENIPYAETRAYVTRVVENRIVYRCLLGKRPVTRASAFLVANGSEPALRAIAVEKALPKKGVVKKKASKKRLSG